jgi:ABC-2 type transport system ATP-binding protein
MRAPIRLREIEKSFGFPGRRRRVLSGVSLSLAPGRVVGLLGRNGAGKTTLLRLLLGQARPAGGGPVWPDGRPPRRVGLPEGRALPPSATAARWHGLFAPAVAARRERLAALLETGGLWRRPVRRLSGGERRRLELVLTLSTDADVFLLDEPTSGLDPVHLEGYRVALRELAAEGATVLVSTHLVREHEDVVDDVVMLHRGRVVAEGEAAALRRQCLALIPERAVDFAAQEGAWRLAPDGRYLCRGEEARRRLEERLRRVGVGWVVEPCGLRDVFLERVGSP